MKASKIFLFIATVALFMIFVVNPLIGFDQSIAHADNQSTSTHQVAITSGGGDCGCGDPIVYGGPCFLM